MGDIVPWKATYAPWLRRALTSFLVANVERGGDMLPTPQNVETLLQLGLSGAAEGDPCLLALDNASCTAFVLWRQLPAALDLRWKTIHAIGSFTEPAYRRTGIANVLRQEAKRQSIALGYERILGPVAFTNEKGMQEFVRQGAWPTHAQWELLL